MSGMRGESEGTMGWLILGCPECEWWGCVDCEMEHGAAVNERSAA